MGSMEESFTHSCTCKQVKIHFSNITHPTTPSSLQKWRWPFSQIDYVSPFALRSSRHPSTHGRGHHTIADEFPHSKHLDSTAHGPTLRRNALLLFSRFFRSQVFLLTRRNVVDIGTLYASHLGENYYVRRKRENFAVNYDEIRCFRSSNKLCSPIQAAFTRCQRRVDGEKCAQTFNSATSQKDKLYPGARSATALR